MQNWEFLPLMVIGMGLLFYMLHYFGLLVVKSGTYTGGASVEVLGPGKVPLYSRYACGSMEERIDCRDLKTFRVRITSENFCGKFDISLE